MAEAAASSTATETSTSTAPAASATVVGAHISKALAHKQRGNEFVAAQEWKRASFEYKHVSLYLGTYLNTAGGGGGGADMAMALASDKAKAAPKPTPDEMAAIRAAVFATLCNMAMVHLQLGRTSAALAAAQGAVDLDAASPKALFRRGRARLAVGLVDEAGDDFATVLKTFPDDAAAKTGMADVAAALATARKAEAKMCAKMFA